MKAGELKEVEALVRRVMCDVARCPQVITHPGPSYALKKITYGRCTLPRGHRDQCAEDSDSERAWEMAETMKI